MNHETGRQIQVQGMAYAPTNEQGVVFLFGRLASRPQFTIERVQKGFPDCIARWQGKAYRIEFEQRASNFKQHGHDPKGADIIVCWENDWGLRPTEYKHIKIIDLKRHVGAQPRIFAVGCVEPAGKDLDSKDMAIWNVPKTAQVDDLVLIYRAGKDAGMIKDIWRIVGPFYDGEKEGWRPGLQAGLKLVARLKNPVTFSELAKDATTRSLGVVRKRFRGNTDITDDWDAIYSRIVSKNQSAKRLLRNYVAD
jgi:hypothetical protein